MTEESLPAVMVTVVAHGHGHGRAVVGGGGFVQPFGVALHNVNGAATVMSRRARIEARRRLSRWSL